MPVMSSAASSANSGPSSFSRWVFSHRSARACTEFAGRAGELLVGDQPKPRLQHLLAATGCGRSPRRASARRRRRRARRCRRASRRSGRRGYRSRRRAPWPMRRAAPWRPDRPRLRLRREMEALEVADAVAFDEHVAGLADLGFEHGIFSQAPHQHAGAAVDKSLGKSLVKGIGQLVLEPAGDVLPVLRICQPVRPVGDEGPGSHMCDARRQRVDVAVGAVGERQLPGEPVRRDTARALQETVERRA